MSTARKPKILCCDDEELLCDLIADELVDGGFDVIKATSGHAALAILATTAVDLVLSDIRMPNGDGIHLLKSLKAIDPTRPVVILMTGFSDVSVDRVLKDGAAAVFSKPIDYAKLIPLLHRLLGTKPAA